MDKTDNIKKSIIEFCKTNRYRLCIFCMGEYGLQLYFKLKEYDITIDCFADNNSEKWGYVLENIYCYSIEELKNSDKNLIIVVAKKNPDDLVEILKDKGFPFVITREDMLEAISSLKVNKSKVEEEYIANLNYSEEYYINLINQFRNDLYSILTNKESNIDKTYIKKDFLLESYFKEVLTNLYKYNEVRNNENC